MKVLLLNPHVDAERKIQEAMASRGYAVLIAGDAQEAWQILQMHGTTIDLAVIHRETVDSKRTPGMDLLLRIKADPQHQDLPLVLTSGVWKDSEFAHHQSTPQAANAYLAWPFETDNFLGVVDQIFGPPAAPSEGTRLEPSEVAPHQTMGEIQLDAPESPVEAAPEIVPAPPRAFDPSQLEPVPGQPPEDVDGVISDQMPYLMKSSSPMLGFAKSIGDAVVPGGAANAPDIETMRQYLLLREQDVAALSSQLRTARVRIRELEGMSTREQGRSSELEHRVHEQQKQIEEFEREKQLALEGLQAEINEMKFQMKARHDRARVLESQVKDANLEMERVKDRVRLDLRKIRARERELESRIEIMKGDSEALIGAREGKIIELKRKLDLLEFNMDLIQDQYQRERDHSETLRERLAKAAQVVRVAGGVLDASEKKAS